MRLSEIVLLSLAAALLIVGTHLLITTDIVTSYPVFMLSVVFLLWYIYKKRVRLKEEEEQEKEKKKTRKKK